MTRPSPSAVSCSDRSGRRSRLLALAEAHGVRIASEAVCDGHCAPLDFVESWVYDRPQLSLTWGPRGGGKSFLAGFASHINGIARDGSHVKVLGGSAAQSAQVFEALKSFRCPPALGGWDAFETFQATSATYPSGSSVSFIPASPKSVRGPHVQTLMLDEVDEIDPEIREAALGMAMRLDGIPSMVAMMSTYHRVGGPMSGLVEAGLAGAYPVHQFCVWEVMERCPDERSGPRLENCPACPLMKWCHSDRDRHAGVPKAKRADGHYAIDDLIAKARAVSLPTFEADYLSLRPKVAGRWFTMFDPAVHVTPDAEFRPDLGVHLAIDVGVHTGAIWLQKRQKYNGLGFHFNVFADHYYEALESDVAGPEKNARAILAITAERCPGVRLRVSMDSAGEGRNVGFPIVRGEYEKAGIRGVNGIERWSQVPGSVADTLQLLETMLRAADGTVGLTIHPRCKMLISALETYKRHKRQSSWLDEPEPLQHPASDLIDPLRCALKLEAPSGRAPEPRLQRVHARSIF